MSTPLPFAADTVATALQPLAARMRPRTLEEFCGQAHLLAPDKPLSQAVRAGRLHSMILWGPPGSGKTTLARLISGYAQAQFLTLSAVLAGVKDIRAAVDQAKIAQREQQQSTLLFVDEVHRFNKAQQDAFLPYVEDGTVTFIGATTENPSFELNNALLSRARVYVLKALQIEDIALLLARALQDTRGFSGKIACSPPLLQQLAEAADGDARRGLNLLEIAANLSEDGVISTEVLQAVMGGGGQRRFDKGGDAFYDQISALHKAVRGSSPDAALYWLARMLDGGCDPLYLARRIVRMAWEDIGLADPRAIQITNDAALTYERLGSPEGELALGQAVIYLAIAAKSNAGYNAYNQARAFVQKDHSREVPVHLRNAPTRLMKELGYGHAYRYAHDEAHAYAAGESYFPDGMMPPNWYQPVSRGLEIKISEKMAFLKNLDEQVHAKK
jgi:putative ATPase